jgi:hypothetical protein
MKKHGEGIVLVHDFQHATAQADEETWQRRCSGAMISILCAMMHITLMSRVKLKSRHNPSSPRVR